MHDQFAKMERRMKLCRSATWKSLYSPRDERASELRSGPDNTGRKRDFSTEGD